MAMQLTRETLVDEHAELTAVIGELVEQAAQRPLPASAVAPLRWRLSRLLLAHLAKEDRLLHPLLQRGGDPVAAALSRRFEEEMGGLADAFKAYMHDWNGQQIADDPDGFETATRGLAAVLADRIRREETQLYRHIPGATPPAEVDAGALRA
ncbi:MAG: hypothetical protein DI625_11290 [Sphingomonas sp.]|jgi:iron-sulfur cluster repair protein YtfE (RIC family)|nr:MAG: hypothetical protein DI625_11290 [Sphingomonas sp.]